MVTDQPEQPVKPVKRHPVWRAIGIGFLVCCGIGWFTRPSGRQLDCEREASVHFVAHTSGWDRFVARCQNSSSTPAQSGSDGLDPPTTPSPPVTHFLATDIHGRPLYVDANGFLIDSCGRWEAQNNFGDADCTIH